MKAQGEMKVNGQTCPFTDMNINVEYIIRTHIVVAERSHTRDEPVPLARSVHFGFGGCGMGLESSSHSGKSTESISSQLSTLMLFGLTERVYYNIKVDSARN